MATFNKLYRVIVAGGLGLATTTAAATVCTGCGNDETPREDAGGPVDAGPVDAGFPSEGPMMVDAGPEDAGFPSEGPMVIDAGPDGGSE